MYGTGIWIIKIDRKIACFKKILPKFLHKKGYVVDTRSKIRILACSNAYALLGYHRCTQYTMIHKYIHLHTHNRANTKL